MAANWSNRTTIAWDQSPVVITVAPTGAEVMRSQNPNIPYSVTETAQASIEAARAGAAAVHLHVRTDDGTPSAEPELFRSAVAAIAADSDLITMISTGGAIWMSAEQRLAGIAANPDVVGVESGSLNFGDETFVTPPQLAHQIIERSAAAGIALEVEAFDVGHVVTAMRWLESGAIPSPLRINLVFGVPGGIDASPEALDAMLRPLAPDTFWTVTAVGRHHWRMLGLALLKGACGIRTGLEDVLNVRRGELAASNGELVETAARLVRSLGRDVATVREARTLMNLPERES